MFSMISPILSVADIEASIRFYTEKLGFTYEWSMTNENNKPTFSCVKLGDAEVMLGVLEGFVEEADRDRLGKGVQLFIRLPQEIDVDALYTQAKTSGATITRDIETRDWGERTFSVKDLDGYHFMISKPIVVK